MAYCINGVLEVLKIKTMLTLEGEEITCKLQKSSFLFNKLYLLSIVSTVIKQQQQRQKTKTVSFDKLSCWSWLVEETGHESRQTNSAVSSLCWKLPDHAQSFVYSSQIVTE